MTLQAGELNLNNLRDLSSAHIASSGPQTMAEDLQKVRSSGWTQGEAKYVAKVWQDSNTQKDMGYLDLSDAPESAEQVVGMSSFAESQPIKTAKRPNFQPSSDLQTSMQPLQEWEGYITDISNSSFRARLIDITHNGLFEQEEARFLFVDVPKDNLTYIAIGAVFRFIVGMRRLPDGKKAKASKIYFRKRPNHSRHDLDQAKREAKEIVEGIVWE